MDPEEVLINVILSDSAPDDTLSRYTMRVVGDELWIDGNGKRQAAIQLEGRTIAQLVDDLRSRSFVQAAIAYRPELPATWLNPDTSRSASATEFQLKGSPVMVGLTTAFGAVLAPGATRTSGGLLDGAGLHFNTIATAHLPHNGRDRDFRFRFGLALDETVAVDDETKDPETTTTGVNDLLEKANQISASVMYDMHLAKGDVRPIMSLEFGGTWNRFDVSTIEIDDSLDRGDKTIDASLEAAAIREQFGRVEPTKYFGFTVMVAGYRRAERTFYGGLGVLSSEVISRTIRPITRAGAAEDERCYEYRCAKIVGEDKGMWRAILGFDLGDVADLRMDAVGGFDRSINPLLRILLIKPFKLVP